MDGFAPIPSMALMVCDLHWVVEDNNSAFMACKNLHVGKAICSGLYTSINFAWKTWLYNLRDDYVVQDT